MYVTTLGVKVNVRWPYPQGGMGKAEIGAVKNLILRKVFSMHDTATEMLK